MKKFAFPFLILLIVQGAYAQQAIVYSDKDYAKRPVWISMIKDTAVNFFEAEKAYKIYFQHHQKPGGEHDVIGGHAKEEKSPSKRELRNLQAENHMRMEVKKYERWRQRMLPYVRDDGSILSPSQRLQIWKSNKSK